MNSYILKSLREEKGRLIRAVYHRTGKRKSTFIDHNDYVVEDHLSKEKELNNNLILEEKSSHINSYILKSLKKEKGRLIRTPYHRTGKKKSTFIDHNDYIIEGKLNQRNNYKTQVSHRDSVENSADEQKAPQLVKKRNKIK